MEIYTIGFTKKSAAQFFGALRDAGIERLIDVRLNNVSQLAGFTKKDDLAFFVRELCGAEYHHEPLLAPTQDMLDRYKKQGGAWDQYEREFLTLMETRRIETVLQRELFHRRSVLLCSEPTPARCHRRLVVEHLGRSWGSVRGVHL